MTPRNASRRALVLAAALIGASAHAMAQDAPDPQVIREGKGDYDWQCAACHGPGGKGDGPMANLLVKQPTDLTGLARANGDKFPFWRVYNIVLGRAHVPGHETFQMPDFWKRFKGQETEFGLEPPHVRVLELTHYLESIQEK